MTWPEFIDQHFWALWWLTVIAIGATGETVVGRRRRRAPSAASCPSCQAR